MIDWPEIPKRKKSTAAWSERTVQDAVYVHCAIKNHEVVVPNSKVFGWESDVISVTRTGFIHEFEIEVSRADFKQDAKKDRARLLCDPVVQGFFGTHTCSRPNYFYYVVPEGLITADEVPDNAGLIYAMEPVVGYHLYFRTTKEVKPAPRIHREKIEEAQRRQLMRSMTVRYWKWRLGKVDAEPGPELSLTTPTVEAPGQRLI